MGLKKWKNEDIEFLMTNKTKSIKELSELLGRTIPSIKNKKKLLGITTNNKWSDKENNIMFKYYETESKSKILNLLPNRSWDNITHHAQTLNINRLDYYHNTTRNTNVGVLLDETNQSYYYIGLLMADGYFTNKKLVFSQTLKSKDTVFNFGEYINCTTIKEYNELKNVTILGKETKSNGKVVLSMKDGLIIPKILEKFDINYEKHNKTKTYYPPAINIFKRMTDEKLIAYIIGFIDGDGHISKVRNGGNSIVITTHINWLGVINYWSYRISKICDIELSDKSITPHDNIIRFKIYNSKIILTFKKFITNNNLNVNNNKWDRVL